MVGTDNPLGILAIDHLEFVCDDLQGSLAQTFYQLGFAQTYRHESDQKILFTQGQTRFLVHQPQSGQAREYLNHHGEGVNKISFLVEDAERAIETAIKRGAVVRSDLIEQETAQGRVKTAIIQGFGDVYNEFVQRPTLSARPGLIPLESDPRAKPLHTRTSRIDHLTNNVPYGEMEHWVEFYKKIFGFKETRYFDIRGQKTGLYSKVVQLSNNAVIIPINQPESEHGKSQIQEFLDIHRGAGVQHIALMTPDILDTVGELRQRGVNFLDIPDTYYELLPERPFKITEKLEDLKQLKLLADGDPEGYLLQIFTQTYIGPLFFEYIQRKNHWGFGEGNFQALFDSMELEQKRRGYL